MGGGRGGAGGVETGALNICLRLEWGGGWTSTPGTSSAPVACSASCSVRCGEPPYPRCRYRVRRIVLRALECVLGLNDVSRKLFSLARFLGGAWMGGVVWCGVVTIAKEPNN